MIVKKDIYLFLLLPILFIVWSCKMPMTDQEKLACLQKYIINVSKTPIYEEVRRGVIDSLVSWRSKKLEVKCCDFEKGVLDSAVFFNGDFSKCLFLFVDSLDTSDVNSWNDVKILGGEKIGNEWHYYHVSFTLLAYSLKSNGYKNLGFDYLSRDARLDIINRGFFKGETCEIDPNFVNSEEWFADWIRKNHDLFLQGK